VHGIKPSRNPRADEKLRHQGGPGVAIDISVGFLKQFAPAEREAFIYQMLADSMPDD
jgi:hypothetical protein